MTVCIAALSDGGKSIVVASDRMVSGADVEFEQDILKIDQLSPLCVALTAGSAVEHVDLLRNCSMIVQDRNSPRVFEIAEVVKESFVELRKKRAEEAFFKPLGLDIQTFLRSQSSLSPDLVLRLSRTLEVAELDLVLIVAGVDYSGGHIYLVSDPGVANCMDALGFCCTGSGEHHASMTFIRSGYSVHTPLSRAMYLVYQAKRDAEVAPGVGDRFTDLAYLKDGDLRFASSELLLGLKELYDENRINVDKVSREGDDRLTKLLEAEGGSNASQNR